MGFRRVCAFALTIGVATACGANTERAAGPCRCLAPLHATPMCTAGSTCAFVCDAEYERCGDACCRPPAVAVGVNATCYRRRDGSLYCWGQNEHGELGDGTFYASEVPVRATAIDFPVGLVALGSGFGCATSEDESLWCWGGLGGVVWGKPVRIAGLSTPARAISAGGSFACAATQGGAAECWGSNGYGELGTSLPRGARAEAKPVSGLASGVKSVCAGSMHACALRLDGTVACWGALRAGGNPNRGDRLTPIDVPDLSDAVSIGCGSALTCALTSSGSVRCWGAAEGGTPDTPANLERPRPVNGLGGPVRALSVGWFDACVITEPRGVKCWGAYVRDAPIGPPSGSTLSLLQPRDVIGLASGVRSVDVKYRHACAILESGEVRCWGTPTGDRADAATATPVRIRGI